MSEDIFSKTKPIWNEYSELCDTKYDKSFDTTKAVWTGGSCVINKKTTNHQMEEVVHLVVGLESNI